MADEHRDQIRIVQETVAGKEITFAHIMGGPAPIIYQKLGLNPQVDYGSSAIGIMNMTPSESAVIASDIAVKSGKILIYRSVIWCKNMCKGKLLSRYSHPGQPKSSSLKVLIIIMKQPLQQFFLRYPFFHGTLPYLLVILHTTYPRVSRK